MKHKQSITLEQWACKAKRILEDAFHKDAIWTPTLELFISECPANPTNPVASTATDHVFRIDDVASGAPVDLTAKDFQPRVISSVVFEDEDGFHTVSKMERTPNDQLPIHDPMGAVPIPSRK